MAKIKIILTKTIFNVLKNNFFSVFLRKKNQNSNFKISKIWPWIIWLKDFQNFALSRCSTAFQSSVMIKSNKKSLPIFDAFQNQNKLLNFFMKRNSSKIHESRKCFENIQKFWNWKFLSATEIDQSFVSFHKKKYKFLIQRSYYDKLSKILEYSIVWHWIFFISYKKNYAYKMRHSSD